MHRSQQPVSFIFCIHNHQPEGNFDSIFESASEDAYRPFLELLSEYPGIKISLQFSGILLRWLEQYEPAVLELLDNAVQRGQVELLGGGFHEPVLPVIPDEDKIGQIAKLTSYLDRRFRCKPRGMWLAERIWEQSLVKPIAEAGMEFTVLDDTHFKYAGLKESDLNRYFQTEEQGFPLKLFPIDKELRYLIPFGTVTKNLAYFRRSAEKSPGAFLVYADDGEKFGVWPDTKKHVWDEGWLRAFFVMLDENKAWLKTSHFADVLAAGPPAGRIYLPDASYAEMMQWALPSADAQGRYMALQERLQADPSGGAGDGFLKGGFWRNFMVKYPEVNQMHKYMLRISCRFHDYVALNPEHRADAEALRAQDCLWAAQCNCGYWHGVFGGVYLPHIRQEVYRNLIIAEALLDMLEDGSGVRIDVTDMDHDGKDDVFVSSSAMSAHFTPGDGGKMVQCNFKPARVNILDIMNRREEEYHASVIYARVKEKDASERPLPDSGPTAKESNLERHLNYDWYRRGSFIDHFLGADETAENFSLVRFEEYGDFANQPYELAVAAESAEIVLARTGGIHLNGERHPVRIEKRFVFDEAIAAIRFRYTVRNLGEAPVNMRFGIEFNMNAFSGTAFDRYVQFDGAELSDSERQPGSTGVVKNASWFSLTDEWDNFVVYTECSKPAEWWRCPIETVSLSEDGFERTYQGSTIIALWDVDTAEEWTVEGVHRIDLHHDVQP